MQPLSPLLNESQVRQEKKTTDFGKTTGNPGIEEIKASMWVIFSIYGSIYQLLI